MSNWISRGTGAPIPAAYVDDGHDVNFSQTANASIRFTGVQLEFGSIATPFEILPWTDHENDCLRYYEVLDGLVEGTYAYSGTTGFATWHFKKRKRNNPTITLVASNDTLSTVLTDSALIYAAPGYAYFGDGSIADAEITWN